MSRLSPENTKWLRDNGYINNGRVEFSDRFLAINSGVTRQGTSLRAPLEAARKQGLIPKSMLPTLPDMTFAEYHNPEVITPKMRELGQEFAKRFTLNYEQVSQLHIGELLKDEMVIAAVHAWPQPVNGIYPRTNLPFNHAILLYSLPEYQAFDNYLDGGKFNDFTKSLSHDYAIYDTAYRLYISSEQVPQPTALQQALEALKTALLALSAWIVKEQQAQPKPAPVAPPNNLLNEMCLGIQSMEGWYEGSRSWRNRNPGNLVFVGQPGATKEPNGRFAVFPTYEAGFQALKNMILNAAKGKSKIYYPEMNLLLFFSVYAPSNDGNNPTKYAEHVAKRMGVNPATFTLKQLL